MDKELKVRKLASASVRRQRSQDREAQRRELYEQREERKRRMMRMSDIYSTDGSDSSRPNSPENDSSADTPSEYSLKTPENSFSPDVEVTDQSSDMPAVSHLLKDQDVSTVKPTILERRCSRQDSLKQIVFGSSLTQPCDFRYDRFSTIIDSIQVHSIDLSLNEHVISSSLSPAEEENNLGDEIAGKDEQEDSEEEDDNDSEGDDDDDDDDDDEEDYTPIELATPVAIRMPISRPAVVSVLGTSGMAPQSRPQKFLVSNISTIMVNTSNQTTPKPNIVEANPTPDVEQPKDYGFPVVQTKSIEVATPPPPPPPSSLTEVEPSSTKSLPTTATVSAENSVKKKSSMPMLTKFTHARMHSIKNFMKPQSISGPPPAVPAIPSTHQSRPESLTSIMSNMNAHKSKQSIADKNLPPSPTRSLTEPNVPKDVYHEQRPQTARRPSQSTIATLSSVGHSNAEITALPSPKTTSPPREFVLPIMEEQENQSLHKKKSFPNFRRRSGSLGQALKFGNSGKSKPPAPEEPLPPLPVIRTPIQESFPPINFPTPPTRSNRTSRKSGMMYSPFPPLTQRGEPIGLGLRMSMPGSLM